GKERRRMTGRIDELAAAPLLGRPTFSTGSFEAARDYVPSFSNPFALAEPTGSFRLSFSHSRTELPHVRFDLIEVDCDRSFVVSGSDLSDRYLLQIPFAGKVTVEQGGRCFVAGAGSVFVINPVTPSRKHWAGSCRQLMVWIDRQAMWRALAPELGYEPDRSLEFSEELDASVAPACPSLVRDIVNVAVEATNLEGREAHWRYVRQLERCLLVDLLTALPHTYSRELDRTDAEIAPYYVRRVERFFRDQFERKIRLSDALQVAGVSARSLFYGFRVHRKTTPMIYLKELRLQVARERLLRAAESGGKVTAIATNCGFPHLGMFSRDYKRRYGESPSATLRRGLS
ncbi:MAG: AraC family transcriptional regulator, partial [Myxococcota bacterium]